MLSPPICILFIYCIPSTELFTPSSNNLTVLSKLVHKSKCLTLDKRKWGKMKLIYTTQNPVYTIMQGYNVVKLVTI